MLTKRQNDILDFLRDCSQEGAVPSVREIARHFGFASTNAVHSHLSLMEQKGVIRREAGKSRNIILRDKPPLLMEIPVFGMIPAGIPSDQEQEADRSIAVSPDVLRLSKNAKTFALEVRGDSMEGAGILDRDVVILEITEPKNRDIVAALIDGQCTLKRYLVEKTGIFLKAENPKYSDLIPVDELIIQGVFRALIRTHPILS